MNKRQFRVFIRRYNFKDKLIQVGVLVLIFSLFAIAGNMEFKSELQKAKNIEQRNCRANLDCCPQDVLCLKPVGGTLYNWDE